MSYSTQRLTKVRRILSDKAADYFYVRDLSNIKWLTAFDGVFDDENAHAMILSADKAVLHTDSRYSRAAAEAARDSEISVDAEKCSHAKFLSGTIAADNPESRRNITLAIEASISLREYRHLESTLSELPMEVEIYETSDEIVGIRAVKDEEEVRRLVSAQSIADAAFAFIVDFISPGMSEREVKIALEDYLIRHGAEGLSFSSIVAAGPNGASPHAVPGETKLESGQTLVLDFGARAHGYCSDMTRTLFIGEPGDKVRRAYEAIRDANESVERMLKPGITGAQAHDLAEKVLADHGFAGAMGHSLGHGVGIDVHEQPVLAPHNPNPLEAGNVVTVEPGIYVSGEFGMRLEDFGIIREEGFHVFTRTSHDMVII